MHIKCERTCIACRNKFNQDLMIRIVKNEGLIMIDGNKKLNGRGAYFCNKSECINKVIKQRLLNKAFKYNIDNCEYDKLRSSLIEN